jgi:hypothetical protein
MDYKKIGAGLGVFAVVLAVGVISVSASQGDFNFRAKKVGLENKEVFVDAIENNDYTAWQELMSKRGRVGELVTEENFANVVKMHQLMEDGKFEEAKDLKKELWSENMKGRFLKKSLTKKQFIDENGDGLCDRAEQ